MQYLQKTGGPPTGPRTPRRSNAWDVPWLVPLQPSALGVTMSQGPGFLQHPGKHPRSPRCLKILSGHREPFYDVPGQTPTRFGSQVDRFAIALARRPGSTVLTLDLSRVARATHPCRTESALASGKDAGKRRAGKAGSVRLG